MILIIGGYGQGKLDFAKKEYGLQDTDFAAGADCDREEIFQRKGICQLHLLVKRMVEENQEPFVYFMEHMDRLKDMVILSDEVGLGIVPMDEKERLWREVTGRICCVLAKEADEVYRVYAGIPMKIKERK